MSNNNSDSNLVRSNLEFINDKMDNLQSQIIKSNEVTSTKPTVNSAKDNNMLYSKMNDMMNKYYATQNELMNKLDNEAKFIKSVGEKYYELDKKIEKEADKL